MMSPSSSNSGEAFRNIARVANFLVRPLTKCLLCSLNEPRWQTAQNAPINQHHSHCKVNEEVGDLVALGRNNHIRSQGLNLDSVVRWTKRHHPKIRLPHN